MKFIAVCLALLPLKGSVGYTSQLYCFRLSFRGLSHSKRHLDGAPPPFATRRVSVGAAVRDASLLDLISALDERSIPYPPNATRLDLVQLLIKAERENEANWMAPNLADRPADRSVNFYESVTESTTEPPPNSVLDELGRPYVHLTSRSPNRALDTLPDQVVDCNESIINQHGRLSITDLLTELDNRDIRYPPTASRADLEQLLRNQISTPNLQGTDLKSELVRDQKRSARRSRIQLRNTQTPLLQSAWRKSRQKISKGLLQSLPAGLRPLDGAKRKVRHISRRLADFVLVDEDGVRDVQYDYVFKEKRKPTRSKVPKTKPYGSYSPLPDRQRSFIVQNFTGISGATTWNGTDILIPDASNKDPISPIPKRIYSPYRQTSSPVDESDLMGRVGAFVADVADRVMWGSYDESLPTGSKEHLPESKHHRTPRGRNWKDRLEERFDYMLGIHEGGTHYNRWTKQARGDQPNGGSYDSFAASRGTEPSHASVDKRVQHRKAIWEEEGNLVSLLFGRTHGGKSLFFERVLDSDSGSVLNLFRSVFKSALLVASYACRWASVRGSLPQPVVVFGMMTAALTAPPRHRIRTLIITLILLRAVGELAHGYVYGNEGWEEDEIEATSDNDKQMSQ